MFEASSAKFCKSVGEGSLLASPSIDVAGRCKVFQVVVKKERRWWSWQSPSYEPSPFSLSQLIKEEDHIKEKVTVRDRDLLTYNKTHVLSVRGKLGSKIRSVLDVELDGSDSVDVEAKFGSVKKSAVDEPQLMEYVATRHIDLQHEYIKQVRDNERRYLAVIVGVCYLKSTGTVTAKKTIKAEEKVDESVTESIATIDEEVGVDNVDDKTITLPAGTPLAYSVCELLIQDDGSMTLCIDNNIKGGFSTEEATDGATSSTVHTESQVGEIFKPILEMNSDIKQKLQTAVLRMCEFPNDIDSCLVLLKQCSRLVCSGIRVSNTTAGTILEKKFLCPRDVWSYVLHAVGFQFHDEDVVEYPTDNTPLLAVLYLYEALIEINDDALIILSTLTQEYAKPLIYLLAETINNKTLEISDTELKPIYEGSNAGQNFVKELNFSVNSLGQILPPSGEISELHGASRALYGLFWKQEYDLETSSWSCVII